MILTFGALNFYSLTPFHTSYAFFIGPDKWQIFRLSPIPLFLLTIQLFIFRKEFEKNRDKEKAKEEIHLRSEIDRYKTKFNYKTDEELEQVINGKGFRDEVVQASKEIIIERQKLADKQNFC